MWRGNHPRQRAPRVRQGRPRDYRFRRDPDHALSQLPLGRRSGRDCPLGRARNTFEAAMKNAFHKSTWSQVKAGDVILVTHDDQISEVTVKEARQLGRSIDNKKLITVTYRFGYATYGVPRDPDETAYIQSRL